MEIQKLIIILQGSQVGFSALVKTVPFELWFLAGRPLIEYLVDGAIQAGISEITFVGPSKAKSVLNHFSLEEKTEKIFQLRNSELKETFHLFHQKYQEVKFHFISSDKVLSNMVSILLAKNFVKDQPFAISTSTDLIYGGVSSLKQLTDIFRASEHPIIGLKRTIVDNVDPQQMVVQAEKITQKVYKLQKISQAKDNIGEKDIFTITSRSILTKQVLEFAKEAKRGIEHPEKLTLEDVLRSMLRTGKSVYGYEIKGESFELLSLKNWRRAEAFLTLNSLGHKKEWQKYFPEIN